MLKDSTKSDSSRNGGPWIDDTGIARWYRNGKLHREDGPALIRNWISYSEEELESQKWINQKWMNSYLHGFGFEFWFEGERYYSVSLEDFQETIRNRQVREVLES